MAQDDLCILCTHGVSTRAKKARLPCCSASLPWGAASCCAQGAHPSGAWLPNTHVNRQQCKPSTMVGHTADNEEPSCLARLSSSCSGFPTHIFCHTHKHRRSVPVGTTSLKTCTLCQRCKACIQARCAAQRRCTSAPALPSQANCRPLNVRACTTCTERLFCVSRRSKFVSPSRYVTHLSHLSLVSGQVSLCFCGSPLWFLFVFAWFSFSCRETSLGVQLKAGQRTEREKDRKGKQDLNHLVTASVKGRQENDSGHISRKNCKTEE